MILERFPVYEILKKLTCGSMEKRLRRIFYSLKIAQYLILIMRDFDFGRMEG